jgi:hypothetical protein
MFFFFMPKGKVGQSPLLKHRALPEYPLYTVIVQTSECYFSEEGMIIVCNSDLH